MKRNKEWIFSGCGVALLLVLVPLVMRLFRHEHSGSTAAQVATITSSTPTQTLTGLSPVTFTEVLRVSTDATLTELQKDEFRRKHQDKLVEWTVQVRSVQRQWEHRADSDFIVVFSPSEQKDNDRLAFDEFAAATFPSNLRNDMIDLHAGDIIRLRGTLVFSDKTPSLRNCQLLERHKP